MTSTAKSRRFALLVLALGAALVACQNKQGPSLPPPTGEGAPAAPQIPNLKQLAAEAPVKAAAAGAGERAGTGSLQALDMAELGPKETGVLTAIAVDEGDRVKKGQVLFRLDSAPAQLAVAQAKAALSAAKVQYDAAKLDFDRTRALKERGSISEDAFDQARSRFEAAQSAVEQADAALGLAQRHLTNMVVTSPIDGIVTEKRMNVGETATLMPPSIVLVVQNIDTLELRARLPETALRTVREGSELSVRFPAVDETRRVRVKRIAPTVDARTRTIQIVAEVDNKDHRLKAGMLAEVSYSDGASAGAEEAKAAEPAQTATAKSERAAKAVRKKP